MSVGMAVVDLSVCADSAVWHYYFNLHFYRWVSFLYALEGMLRERQMEAET